MANTFNVQCCLKLRYSPLRGIIGQPVPHILTDVKVGVGVGLTIYSTRYTFKFKRLVGLKWKPRASRSQSFFQNGIACQRLYVKVALGT